MMLGILTEIISKTGPVSSVRDRLQMLHVDGTEDGEPGSTDLSSTLFECEGCDTVYVATEKTECGNCGETVSVVENSDT